jgi:hypothetical protein
MESEYDMPSWYYKVAQIVWTIGCIGMVGIIAVLILKIYPLEVQQYKMNDVWVREYPIRCQAEGGHVLYNEYNAPNFCITGKRLFISVPGTNFGKR